MAGAVHNFHIHHYLGEPMNYENIIGKNVIPLLFQGPLTSCLSIDFVELACYSLPFLDEVHKSDLTMALLYHLNSLLNYQNQDGGWYESEKPKPTAAAGMNEDKASSCSYGTWFRICSIAMISITLLNSDKNDWTFRNTLGMGYHPNKWNSVTLNNFNIDRLVMLKYKKMNLPHVLFNNTLELVSKLRK
jgi:hypothetical protein